MHSIIDNEIQFYELRSDGVIECGDIWLNSKSETLKINDRYTKISHTCFKMLYWLIKNKGNIVSIVDLFKSYARYERGMLIEPVIGVHINKIRRIIGKHRIEVIYKSGYKFIE